MTESRDALTDNVIREIAINIGDISAVVYEFAACHSPEPQRQDCSLALHPFKGLGVIFWLGCRRF